mgnify:CR=1 FL=1
MKERRRTWAVAILAFAAGQVAGCATSAHASDDLDGNKARVEVLLSHHPLIDGHNDVPWQFRKRVDNQMERLDFSTSTKELKPVMHTDIPRLRAGLMGGQFWSVYVPSSLEPAEAVRTTLEQMDVVHQMVARYPDDLALALTAQDILKIHHDGKIASLIGVEGGHSIGNSLGVLRMLYDLGARYLTLTHWSNTDWADAATDEPEHGGLTEFGRQVVREMNRLGMMVDLSHVSAETMRDVLETTAAPVICSHSGAYGVNPHPRNVPDDVLKKIAEKGGVVMVDFLPAYVSKDIHNHGADRQSHKARMESLHLGNPAKVAEMMADWDKDHPWPVTDQHGVIAHIDHIRDVIGIDYIGIGSDFDGMGSTPDGLEDVSTYPSLFAHMMAHGYSEDDIRKIAGANILRAMEQVEQVAKRLSKDRAADMGQIGN